MTFEYKAADVSGLQIEDEGNGIVTAIVSVTGIKDAVNDIIEPGAYRDTLTKRLPKGIWHHDWKSPVSKTLEAKELLPLDPELPETLADGKTPWPSNAGALKIKQQFNLNTERGRTAYEDVKFFGADQEWSIGYRVPAGKATRDAQGTRHIKSLDLYEYSPVLVGTMPLAHTLSVKDAQTAWREAEETGEFKGYDPADDDWERKDLSNGATGMGDDYQTMLDKVSELLPLLNDLQGFLTQASKQQREMEYAQDRLDEAQNKSLGPANAGFRLRMQDPDDDGDYDDFEQDDDLEDEAADQVSRNPITQGTPVFESTGTLILKELTEQVGEEWGTKDDQTDLIDAADDVDAAIEDDDLELLDSKAAEFLDLLEEAIEGAPSEQKDDLRLLAQATGEMLQEAEEKAAQRSLSEAARKEAADKGEALPDGSFPIRNPGELRKAIMAHGRASDPEKAKRHIIKRAKAMGLTDKLPDDWQTKADDEETVTLNLHEFDVASLLR